MSFVPFVLAVFAFYWSAGSGTGKTFSVTPCNYKPIGTVQKIGNLDVYFTGDISSKRVLIAYYDIFGFTPRNTNVKQVCDILGKQGFLVVLPDFYGGEYWDLDNFPPVPAELGAWLGKVAPWTKVLADTKSVIEHCKGKGATGFGVFGFCWGGKQSILLGGSELAGTIKGGAMAHPAGLTMADAENNKIPILFMPSKNEDDLLPMVEAVQKRLGKDAAEHYRFDDMNHGFSAARGNFNDTTNRARVEEVLGHLIKFFNKHLPE